MNPHRVVGRKNLKVKNKKNSLLKRKLDKKHLTLKNQTKKNKLFLNQKLIFIFFLLLLTFLFKFGKKEKNKENNNKITININNKISRYLKYEEEFKNKNSFCDEVDPIFLYKQRTDRGPIIICSGEKSKHICYQNPYNNSYNNVFVHKNGTICLMENIILDPSHSRQTGRSYDRGPTDFSNRGTPLLDKGFFNAQCKLNDSISLKIDKIYNTYFNSWNYEYDIKNEGENLEELAPGKTVFFMSRNQDSPNLFHGYSDIVNALVLIYLFNLDPEEIQVVFLESMDIPYYKEENSENKDLPRDPFYDIYKKMIGRGGEPIYIKNLKKKYKISKAFHVPLNWDSPLFINIPLPKCESITKTYKFINDFADKYLDIKPYKNKFLSNNENLYYPEAVLKNHESNTKFDKIVTIQWRRVWPKKRRGQQRVLNNGPQLADKLASVLPKNILVRLIDTAQFTMEEQISIMRSTDYLTGLHGAGLTLSMFLPTNSIYHEFHIYDFTSVLGIVSNLSGHKSYVDKVKNTVNNINGNQMVYFDEDDFANRILQRMKENNFF